MATANTTNKAAKIVVVGAGWWTQGWHLPHLHRNPKAEIAAIIDTAEQPRSNLNPNLEPLSTLRAKYNCPSFSSVEELFNKDSKLAASIDGVIVCTPHATHSDVGGFLLEQAKKRKEQPSGGKPLHILMEKPFTTSVDQAKQMHDAVQEYSTGGFLINHSANYTPQAQMARDLIKSGRIGQVRHITASFASPLSWIFEDPSNTGWNQPTPGLMLGNGFAWGQQSHLLSWIYHVCGPSLIPHRVFCKMGYSHKTGADVSHAATIQCTNGATFSLSGTSLLPGNAHSDPPVGKQVKITIYGTDGALSYSGDDRDPSSGRLELRIGGEDAGDREGNVEVYCEDSGFVFEELDQDGAGPQSVQNFIAACLDENYYVGADSLIGFRSVQTLDAMYRSDHSGNAEQVMYPDT